MAHAHTEDSAANEHDPGSSEHSEHGGHDHSAMIADFRRRFWISLVLSIPILLLSPLIQSFLGIEGALDFTGDSYVVFAVSTVVFFYGGWPFLTGLVGELRELQPGMMTLIALAIAVAYVYSSAVVFGLEGKVFFWELATLIVVMLLGHWIEMRSVQSASGALEELIELMPSTALRVKAGGETEEVEITELEAGDHVRVKPGGKIPIDGTVVEGRTRIDESMLTGESEPVEKSEEDTVIGGSVNGESTITVAVEKTGEDTYLSQVVDMVREAQQSRSRSQDLADRAAMWLTFVALGAGAITLAAWLSIGRDFQFSLARMVTVMVITCPHALGLAIPLVVAVSTTLSARHGLLVRNRSAFERARDLDAVVFDKTGTLTQGRFGVQQVIPFGNASEERVLTLAASLESHSEHPIGEGIVEAAQERELELHEASGFEAIPGKGAQANVDGETVKVVSPGYLEENGIEVDDDALRDAREQGHTVVHVLSADEPVGAIALADLVRDESRAAIDRLRELGLEVMMITGDSEAVAKSVAKELGLDDVFAEVLPDEKADKIEEVRERGLRVAMVGDGVNDAPALATADLGVAIGAGTDVAIESADVVLVRSDPRDVPKIMDLAQATYRKTVQNLWWASGYNIVAIPLAAGVLAWAGIMLSPAVGALLMSISTVIVAINAKLLGRTEVTTTSAEA